MHTALPDRFHHVLDEVLGDAKQVEGWLTDREVKFLTLASACCRAPGRLLELGSYHGKSTIVLAKASRMARQAGLVSVDPFSPEVLTQNLKRMQVEDLVEVRKAYSQDFLQSWRDPIRMLWHDGSNVYDDVKVDLRLARPHLSDKAVVAFHDVLNTSGERIRVFIEDVLENERFGPVGVCGSIGWGVFRKDARAAKPFQLDRLRLARQLRRLVPFHVLPARPQARVTKVHYRVLRWLVPHGEVQPDAWLGRAA